MKCYHVEDEVISRIPVLYGTGEQHENIYAKEFLLINNVDFVTYWNNFFKEDDFLNYIGNDWDGAIPATFIYDKNGNLVTNFIGKRTYEYFRQQIEPLL
jgi:hypothetical protein